MSNNTNETNGDKPDPATVGSKRLHSQASKEWELNPTPPVVIQDEKISGHVTWQNNPFYDYAFPTTEPRKGGLNDQGHLDMNDDFTLSSEYKPPTSMELNWGRNMSKNFGAEVFLTAMVYDQHQTTYPLAAVPIIDRSEWAKLEPIQASVLKSFVNFQRANRYGGKGTQFTRGM